MPVPVWVKEINLILVEFYREKYGLYINVDNIGIRGLINENGAIAKFHLRPQNRHKFMKHFCVKKPNDMHFFSPDEWLLISSLLENLKTQSAACPLGSNSLKKAADYINCSYYKARQLINR